MSEMGLRRTARYTSVSHKHADSRRLHTAKVIQHLNATNTHLQDILHQRRLQRLRLTYSI